MTLDTKRLRMVRALPKTEGEVIPKGRKGRKPGLKLNDQAIAACRLELDARAWTQADWALAAGVHSKTVTALVVGRRVERATLRKLLEAFDRNPQVEGLAELLMKEEYGLL